MLYALNNYTGYNPYPPYGYNQDWNPYGFNSMAQNQPPPPRYGIQKINSDVSIDRFPMGPSDEVLLMHQNEPYVYLVQTDSTGGKKWAKYQVTQVSTSDENEVDSLKNTISKLNQRIANMEALLNDPYESDDGLSK